MPPFVERFSRRQRTEHWIIALLFFILVLTGLPQKYPETGWAGWIVWALGGLDIMRWLHRMAGLLFSTFTLYFVGYVVIDTLRGRTALTMVPLPADLKEVYQSLLWYAGLEARPRSPRFDYREKFEFWGMLFGGLIMVATGMMLYFPLLTARWLPGQFIPAAKTVHSYEALLALMVIVLWHLYNTIFRPSVFPLDRTMIDGKMLIARLKEEYTRAYLRLVPEDGE
ncbi:MAG: cytochrome b/b6 domain-containing protein, partial [Nitrospinota bacterium]|nr:cytochrome b/b6 domain-containing protein [Nitrospinota bacterium]